MKSLSICFFFSLIVRSSLAQLDIQNVSFWNHYGFINPSMSALEYKQRAAISYEHRYFTPNYSISSVFANYDTKIGKQSGIGICYRFLNDFFFYDSRAILNYNYQIELKEDHTLSLGAGIGLENQVLHKDIYDETFTNVTARTDLDFTAGITYTNQKLLLGSGVTRIASTSLHVKSKKEPNYFYLWREQFYLHGAYPIAIANNVELKPQFLIQTNFDFTSINVNLMLTMKKKLWLGGSYHGNRTFSGTLGYDFKEKYRIGYTYQQYISSINGYKNRSHEFTLGLLLH